MLSMELAHKKILDLNSAIQKRNEIKNSNKTLTITNGCFDLLHAGHVFYLNQAAKLGDNLWLFLNSDTSVQSLKGPHRPVQSEIHRSYVVASLESIDAVVIFNNTRLDKEILSIKPDIYVKAGDYNLETMNQEEKKSLEEAGTEIRFLPFLEGFSSTHLMNKISQTNDV